MKITFYSNFLNHHQLPFCLEMQKRLGENFRFVATTPIEEEKITIGYEDMNKKYPFVITAYDSKENETLAMELAVESDVIIHGSAPEKYIKIRMGQNKLTFRYSERIFKKGRWNVLRPRRIAGILLHHTRYKNKNLYMLCASAYTAGDMAMGGAYIGKTFKWGYFPEVKTYDVNNLFEKKQKERPLLLWCGRFLDWKHPEKAVLIAERLKKDGYMFDMHMIGIGVEQNSIKELIDRKRLNDCVSLLGAKPANEVRGYMEKTNIFLFTSDQNEGWGAVLNEAMNSGCAVVASDAIGSVPFLLKDGENGLIYKDKDFEDLYAKVKFLIENTDEQKKHGTKAYYTIAELWNAEVAAARIIELAEKISDKDIFGNGPCSKAELM